MASRPAISPIDALPPEILQTIWRNLSLFDLLRCQQVCKHWNSYLPGDDQALHRALFSPAIRQEAQDEAKWYVFINFKQRPELKDESLPKLQFSLDIEGPCWYLDDEYDNCSDDDNEGAVYHPVLSTPDCFAKLIHPRFCYGSSILKFVFHAFETLEQLTYEVERSNENWESMLARVPAVKKLKIQMAWLRNVSTVDPDVECDGHPKDYILENNAGVTVWDYVELIRRVLRDDSETEVKKHAGDLFHISGYRVRDDLW